MSYIWPLEKKSFLNLATKSGKSTWWLKTCISHHKGDTLSNRSEASQSPHFTHKVKLGRTKINTIPPLSTLELGTHFLKCFQAWWFIPEYFQSNSDSKKNLAALPRNFCLWCPLTAEAWIKVHPLKHKCWSASPYITLSQMHPSLPVTICKYRNHHQQNHLSFLSWSVFHNRFPWQLKWQFFYKFLIKKRKS